MKDLENRADVEELVVAFYRAAFADPLIGPVFTEVAKLDLNHHLPIMCDFWETVLFHAGLYHRNALQIHLALNARVPLGTEHFDRWLALWSATLDDRFAGPVTDRAKLQADRIAGSMLRRMQGRSGSAFETITRREPEVRVEGTRSTELPPAGAEDALGAGSTHNLRVQPVAEG